MNDEKPQTPQAKPEWKTRLRASQEQMQAAFVASGITEEELDQDILDAIKSYRAERSLMEFDRAFGPIYAVAAQRSGKPEAQIAATLKAPGQVVSRRKPPLSREREITPKALALLETIRQWQAEDEAEQTNDEAELERRDQERAEHEANLDAPRRQAGMRLLFPGLE